MPITTGHNGERVHYQVRTFPRPLSAMIFDSPEKMARDTATKDSVLPDGAQVYSRMARYGRDIYVHTELDLTGALNPLGGLYNHSAPRWFNDADFLPLPPAQPVNRRSPTNPIARLAYSMAHMMSSLCNGFMRWLSA